MKKKLLLLLSFLPLFVVVICLFFLNEQIPAHYDFEGNITRWGSKYEKFYIAFSYLGIGIFLYLVGLNEEKKALKSNDDQTKKESLNNCKIIYMSGIFIMAFLNILNGYFMYKSFNIGNELDQEQNVNIINFVFTFTGLLFMAIANYIPKSKKNFLFGIRTKWSLKNEYIWLNTQRYGAILFFVAGLIIFVLSCCLDNLILLYICLGLMVLLTIGSTLISYYFYNKWKTMNNE